jgi:hypothetical protein
MTKDGAFANRFNVPPEQTGLLLVALVREGALLTVTVVV